MSQISLLRACYAYLTGLGLQRTNWLSPEAVTPGLEALGIPYEVNHKDGIFRIGRLDFGDVDKNGRLRVERASVAEALERHLYGKTQGHAAFANVSHQFGVRLANLKARIPSLRPPGEKRGSSKAGKKKRLRHGRTKKRA